MTMKPTNYLFKGLSLMGIAISGGFHETDENVLSIINDVMHPNKNKDREMIASDFQRIRNSFITNHRKVTDGKNRY